MFGMRSARAVYCAALLLLQAFASAAFAAQPAPPANPPPASAEELRRLVATLQDDKARAQLIKQLQALIAAQQPGAAAPTTPLPVITARFAELSQNFDALVGEVLAGAAVVVDAPRLVRWVQRQIADPTAVRRWAEFGVALLLVFGSAAIVEWVCRRVVARLLPRFVSDRDRPTRLAGRFELLAFLREVLPVLVFTAACYALLPASDEPFSLMRIALTILVQATVAARLILCAAGFALVTANEGAGVVRLAEQTRRDLYLWIRRFTLWAVFGNAVAAALWWLGAPGGVYALILKLVWLVLAILAIVLILQSREAVAGWLGGDASEAAPHPGWYRVRRGIGEVWHLVAILYIVAVYAIYALRVDGGITLVLRATLLSIVVIVAARLLGRRLDGLGRAAPVAASPAASHFPVFGQRVERYVPILTWGAGAAIWLLAGLAVLQAWNIHAFAWFGSGLGRRIGATLLSIAAVVAVALVVWEIFAAAIERHLNAMEASGAPQRARLRTLLPLLRTALLVVIVVLVALTVLSQIGIDIAPLLAGAGIVGVAIGFGSQALVKDIITGVFILVEDQIAVGDIVDVGKDHAGVVEAISMRTIRLRDLAGNVHTVPFSEVTSVKNLTRDFSYVVARISISYSEDIDRVVEVLREASEELMADEAVRPLILDPFDFQGVEALNEFSVVLLLRIRTLPARQWTVGRAFNRVVKRAFDRHGIAGRDPNPIVITGAAAGTMAGGWPGEAGEPPRQAVTRARSR